MLSEYQKGLRPISEALAVSGHRALVLAWVHLAEVRVSGLQASAHRASDRLAWVRVCRALVSVRALVCRVSVLARGLVCRASVSVRALVYRASVLVRVLVCRVSVPVWGRGDVSDQRGHCLPGGFRPWLRRLRKAQ